MTVDFAKEYLLDDCADCPENKDGECMTQSHCFEVKRMAIQALEQEPCEDAISRQAVLDLIADYDLSMGQVVRGIHALPSVITEKTGHWILLDECSNSGYYCSECHKKVVKEGWSETVKKIKFCPNCGAKMVEPQESEDKE